MSAPLYFLPKLHAADLITQDKRLKASVLRERQLFDLFGDVANVEAECSIFDLKSKAPGGHSGLLLCACGTRPPTRLGYYPDFQEWKPVGKAEDAPYWIGLDKESAPTPEDLVRSAGGAGYRCELADGREWIVPVIRRPDGSTELPRDLVWDDAGVFQEQVQVRYQQIWERTEEALEWFRAGFNTLRGKAIAPALRLAIDALALLYRYDQPLHNRLRLINSENWMSVLAFVIDAPLIYAELEAEKKKRSPEEPELLSTATG